MLLTSQMQILCSLEKIYRAEYKYHLLRHISRKHDANPLALFGRSNYQPSRKPFPQSVEEVFRSSFLLFLTKQYNEKCFPETIVMNYIRLPIQFQRHSSKTFLTTNHDDIKMEDGTKEKDADEYRTTVVKVATTLICCMHTSTMKIT